MKVIGAGFGRCGTTSTHAALEMLGLAPCYHAQTLNPAPGTGFHRPEQAEMWIAAAAGRPVDWKREMAGVEATVDWPGCAFYQPLLAAFPEAKVLLNVRHPNGWYDSVAESLYQPFKRRAADTPQSRVADAVIWTGTFKGRFEDRAFALSVFHHHYDGVRRSVPVDQLLEFDVRQGWEPLCRFLERPVPAGAPFPRLNDRGPEGGEQAAGHNPHRARGERK